MALIPIGKQAQAAGFTIHVDTPMSSTSTSMELLIWRKPVHHVALSLPLRICSIRWSDPGLTLFILASGKSNPKHIIQRENPHSSTQPAIFGVL